MTLALFRAATQCCFRISRSSEGLKSFTRTTLPIILGGSTTLCLVGFNLRNVKAEAPSKREKEILPSRVVEAKSEKLSSTDPSKDHPFPWIKFLGYITPHFHYLICAVSSAIAVAYFNIKIPLLLGDIVNVVSSYISETVLSEMRHDNFLREMKEPALSMIKFYAAQSICTIAYIYSLACLGERMAASLRKDLFNSIICQDIAFFDEHKTGEIVSRLSADVQEFKSSFKLVISQGLRSSAQASGCIVSMYMISPQMTSAMGVIVPTVILGGTYIGSYLRVLSKKAQAQVAKATAVGEECISNIRTVRGFAMEDAEMELYSREVDKTRDFNEALGLGIGVFQGASNFFLNSIVLGTITYGGYLMSDDNLNPGQLMSFLVSVQTIQRSITQVSLLFGHLVKGMASGSRIFEYIEKVPLIPISGGVKIPYHSFFGDVEFKNITFSYPTRPEQAVLKDFSLRIPPSKTVALVGTSGGGKTTIAALLERFYDINGGGSLEIDGINIRDLDPSWLRGSAIGYINQEPVLFATSVIENIRYGRPNATDNEVYEAAKAAHVDDFVRTFPDGYSTILGERGVTVSGGQKQRIAIARALLKNPPILILDEATSALDAESERIVQEALDKLSKGRTSLVIAHRLSTIKNADVIAVIDKGVMAEIGTHAALKRKGGIYSRLIEQQEFRE
ncbi:mitochondrial potassium channel ATP-binding subunit [Lepeophtheirus salmonis]|uniref:mitochondrial potassium channel ATP-binding subunit n=1 Tax=Lepeophtheirus salmonis TaxID=72036 RepID=UPI001AE113E0|nr:mitochondrial potassium channel ATP-binding subunit-like [Lepeophtheirus salmonis]